MRTYEIRVHFDKISFRYDIKKPKYYYRKICELYSNLIPPGKRVLDLGCGTGEMLNFLKPSYGVGIDISIEMINIAKGKFPEYNFYVAEIENFSSNEKFDFILMVDVIEHLTNIEKVLDHISSFASNFNTVFIASWYNPKWELCIKLADFLKLKMPEGKHKSISLNKFSRYLKKKGYEVIQSFCKFALPINILGVSNTINTLIEKCSLLQPFLFTQVIIFKKVN